MRGAPEIAGALAAVRERVERAATDAGRDAAAVRIVAVTKRLGADAVRGAYAAGQRDFGENYVQEAAAKIDELDGQVPGARWHLLGRLQSNKASRAAALFDALHAVDSPRTVTALSKAAAARGDAALGCFLQVRLGSVPMDSARGGVEPDGAEAFLEAAAASAGVRFDGLMGVAAPAEPARPQFAALRELAGRLRALGLPHAPLPELSMGMTGDFEDAVREGATLVRIGTAIFGQRPQRDDDR